MTVTGTLANLIREIGTPRFAPIVSRELRSLLDFEQSAIVHHTDTWALILDDNFDHGEPRSALGRYVSLTRVVNPILLDHRAFRAVRASDFHTRNPVWPSAVSGHLVADPEEELGFRTHGWPRAQEEISLVLRGDRGDVEISLYRGRRRRPVGDRALRQLTTLALPLTAAFERHQELARYSDPLNRLTAREREIVELVLAGCSSSAIALRLGIGIYTVKDHRKSIFRKLAIGSLQELFARYAGSTPSRIPASGFR